MNRPSNRNQPAPPSVTSGAGGEIHQWQQAPDRPSGPYHGAPERDDQHSLMGAKRCATLREDFVLREKILRFD